MSILLSLKTNYLLRFPVTASLPTLVAGVSLLVVGVCTDIYGRKIILLLASLTATIGYCFLSFSTSVDGLLIGQLFVGICQGSMFISTTVYITESIAPHNLKTRNALAGWTIIFINIGITLDYILGAFVHFNQVAMFGAIYSLISFFIVSIFLPESPAWLQQKGRYKDAAAARKRITLQPDTIIPETKESTFTENSMSHEKFTEYLKGIRRKDIYKPVLIVSGLFIFLEFSGVVIYTMHQVEITQVKYISVNINVVVIISGILLIVSQIMYTYIVPQIGLKKVAMIGAAGTGMSSFVLALCLNLNQSKYWYSYLVDYLHILIIWINSFFSNIIAAAALIISSELFPTAGQGFSALPYMFNSVCLFFASMSYQYTIVYIGYITYIIFAIVSFCNIFYIHYFIPETVGKTLQELSDAFLT